MLLLCLYYVCNMSVLCLLCCIMPTVPLLCLLCLYFAYYTCICLYYVHYAYYACTISPLLNRLKFHILSIGACYALSLLNRRQFHIFPKRYAIVWHFSFEISLNYPTALCNHYRFQYIQSKNFCFDVFLGHLRIALKRNHLTKIHLPKNLPYTCTQDYLRAEVLIG